MTKYFSSVAFRFDQPTNLFLKKYHFHLLNYRCEIETVKKMTQNSSARGSFHVDHVDARNTIISSFYDRVLFVLWTDQHYHSIESLLEERVCNSNKHI